MEIFKKIKGYDNYEISNFGNVRSIYKNGNIKYRRPKFSNGYYSIGLWKSRKVKYIAIHRLVADAFLDKNDFKYYEGEDLSKIDLNDLQVNHKDENKTNNSVDNLEWCTAKYNTNYGTSRQRQIETFKSRNGNCKKVKCIETDTVYKSGLEAQKYTGIDNTSISDCCRGKAKSAHGFHFIFVDEGGI